MREKTEYELHPEPVNIAMNFLYYPENESREAMLYHMKRYLTNMDLSNQPLRESHYYLDEIFVLAECWENEPDIDLMLVEINNGGDHLHKIADVIFRHSPLLRSHKELVIHARKFQAIYKKEQQRIKDEIERIYEDQEAGRGGSRGGGESEFITPFL